MKIPTFVLISILLAAGTASADPIYTDIPDVYNVMKAGQTYHFWSEEPFFATEFSADDAELREVLTNPRDLAPGVTFDGRLYHLIGVIQGRCGARQIDLSTISGSGSIGRLWVSVAGNCAGPSGQSTQQQPPILPTAPTIPPESPTPSTPEIPITPPSIPEPSVLALIALSLAVWRVRL